MAKVLKRRRFVDSWIVMTKEHILIFFLNMNQKSQAVEEESIICATPEDGDKKVETNCFSLMRSQTYKQYREYRGRRKRRKQPWTTQNVIKACRKLSSNSSKQCLLGSVLPCSPLEFFFFCARICAILFPRVSGFYVTPESYFDLD